MKNTHPDRVTHLIHHADPDPPIRKRESIIKHQASPRTLTSYQVTGLALELSRQADGTINGETFAQNCERAFTVLVGIQEKIEQLQKKEPNHESEPS